MTQGIHHITAIASNANDTFTFYTKILGLRLVKKTVNQDDTATYHLFFGDKFGEPGMDLTFFIFLPSQQGIRGNGLVTTISLAVPKDALPFWKKRFEEHGVKHLPLEKRFGAERIVFYDTDDQQLELVVCDLDQDSPAVWTTKEVSKANAIQHFYSATLSVVSHTCIEPILKHVFGYDYVATEGQTHLFETKISDRAKYIEVIEQPSAEQGFNAAGTVHHIAFRARDEEEELSMQK